MDLKQVGLEAILHIDYLISPALVHVCGPPPVRLCPKDPERDLKGLLLDWTILRTHKSPFQVTTSSRT